MYISVNHLQLSQLSGGKASEPRAPAVHGLYAVGISRRVEPPCTYFDKDITKETHYLIRISQRRRTITHSMIETCMRRRVCLSSMANSRERGPREQT